MTKTRRSSRVTVNRQRIRELMRAGNVTHEMLGSYMGYSGEYVANCIATRKMSPLMVMMFAKYFDVPEDEIREESND